LGLELVPRNRKRLPLPENLPTNRVNILLVTARPFENDVGYRSVSRCLQQDICTVSHALTILGNGGFCFFIAKSFALIRTVAAPDSAPTHIPAENQRRSLVHNAVPL